MCARIVRARIDGIGARMDGCETNTHSLLTPGQQFTAMDTTVDANSLAVVMRKGDSAADLDL